MRHEIMDRARRVTPLAAFDTMDECEGWMGKNVNPDATYEVRVREHDALRPTFLLSRASRDVESIGSRTAAVLPTHLSDHPPCYVAQIWSIRGDEDMEVFIWDGLNLTEANEVTSLHVATRVWTRSDE